ncbi:MULTISPECIES: peptidase T [unclassified Sporosarcina]|uniref:peptidase T n=1 Tax=unclassified Sporosarcina TaxID=2647733 RepID=UPI00203FE7E5|nr:MULTISPECIES: peptidase T [unclassified Sporosarcina]GKV64378.1 peptidase T [Sporosarcina sp. NCCP-2331]GLB55123.1 peptidase T [Sporosarcina sp. NCCP-2378]
MKEQLIERFIRYAKIDTQSDAASDTTPSTAKQWDLLHLLENELAEIGLEDISLDENGYLFATLPSNTDKKLPTVGFLAHVDTATDYTGTDVNPQRIDNYDGQDIQLNENTVMTTAAFPELNNYHGHTLITTDGTTLLGADDKAGITEIMTAMKYIKEHPEIKHGKVRVGFTPDEEIGRGPHKFDVEHFGADYAYTMDGGPLGELQYESFNAAGAEIVFRGTNVHPGTAKGKMVNSLLIAAEFQAAMPANEIPQETENYEGFIHLMDAEGSVEKTVYQYIIRDHDRQAFEARKQLVKDTVKRLQEKHGEQAVELTMADQYFNMREKIEPVIEIVDLMADAYRNLGIEPKIEPIRGGTDGSQLSFMGMPTPNVFTGGENYHGKYEFISADSMVKATEVIIEALKLQEQRG